MINVPNLTWRAECCNRERRANLDQHYDRGKHRSKSEDQDYAFLLHIDTMP